MCAGDRRREHSLQRPYSPFARESLTRRKKFVSACEVPPSSAPFAAHREPGDGEQRRDRGRRARRGAWCPRAELPRPGIGKPERGEQDEQAASETPKPMPIQVGSLWPLKCSFEYVHWAAARITTQAGSAAAASERNAPAGEDLRVGPAHAGDRQRRGSSPSAPTSVIAPATCRKSGRSQAFGRTAASITPVIGRASRSSGRGSP